MNRRRRELATGIILLYILAGVLWILASDRQLAALYLDKGTLTYLQTYKGWGFVLISAFFFYLLVRAYTRPRREAEDAYRNLVEHSIQGFVVLQNNRIVFSNQATASLFGYTLDEFYRLTTKQIVESIHPEDLENTLETIRQVAANKDELKVLGVRMLTKGGQMVQLVCSMIALVYEGQPSIQITYSDISEQKKAEESLRRKDRILKAVGVAAEQFLKTTDWTETIQGVLEQLGQATDASRVTIFKKLVTSRGTILVSQIYAWTGPGATSQEDNIHLQGMDIATAGFQRWLDALDQFKPVHGIVREFPESEQPYLAEQDIKSILIIPVRVGDDWWGYIDFEDCLNERSWPASEIEALETAVSMLGAVIQRKYSDQATERRVREMQVLHYVSQAQEQAKTVDELLERVTKIIGETLYPDNFGFMLLEDNGKKLRQHVSYYGVTPSDAPEQYPSNDGLTGEAVITGKPIRAGDVRKHKKYIEVNTNTKSELCVPIKIGGRILGVINAESRDLDAFGENDERLLVTIASGLANAIEKIRLFENEQLRRREAEAQNKVAVAASSSLDLNNVLDTILASLQEVIPYDSATIYLLKGGNTCVVATRGFPASDNFPGNFSVPRNKIFEKIQKSGRALLVEDITKDKHFSQWSSGADIHAWIGVPLIARGEVIGFMTLDGHRPGMFNESQKSLAQAVGYQAAGAIQNARSFDAEQSRRKEAEILRQASEAVSSSLKLKQVLDNLLNALQEVIPYDSASVFFVEREAVRVMACHTPDQGQQEVIGKIFPLNNPLLQEVKAQARPVILEDSQNDPRFKKWGGTDFVHGWMGIPLVVRSEIIGFITLDSREKGAFDQDDANLAQAFSYQAAAALQNAMLYQAAVRAAERSSVLHRLSQDVILATQDPEKTYLAIHKAARELMECDAFIIAMRNESVGENDILYITEGNERYEPRRLKSGVGISGKVIDSGKTLMIKDVSQAGGVNVHFGSGNKVQSVLAAPLRIRDKVIGMIAAESYLVNAYTDEERILLEMLASHAATALESARLYRETQRRLLELESLVKASRVLSQTMELEQLLQGILDSAREAIPEAEKGSILLLNAKEQLQIRATSGYSDERVLGAVFSSGKGYAAQVVANRRAVMVPDVNPIDEDSQASEIPEIQNIKSAIVAPLLSKEQAIGCISLDNASRPSAFKEDDLRLLVTLAAPAALAIENARLFSEIRHRLNELVAVNLMSSALRSAQTLDELLPTLVDEMLDILELQAGAIWLLDQNSGKFYQAEARGWFTQLHTRQLESGEGIVGYTYQMGETYSLGDFSTDPHLHPDNLPHTPPGWAGVCIPIRSAEESVGVLVAATHLPRHLNDDDIRLLTTFADMAGSAIHRMSLYQRVERQVKRLVALRDVDTAITSSFDLRVTLTILIDNAVSHLEVDAAAVLLFNPNSQTLTYAAGRGFHTSGITRSMTRIGDGLAGKCALDRKLISEPDLNSSPLLKRMDLLAGENFVSYFGVPLIAKGQIKGVLEVYHRSPLNPSPGWLDFFQTLAGQAAIAIDNTQMFDKLQRSNQELIMAYDTTLEGWSKALELRDRETEGHSQRVTEMTIQMARRMGIQAANLVHVRRGVLLHDIGKMGIPDHILRKTGELTESEWESMRQHPQLAYDLLYPITYLRPALDIPYCHHERWDGTGYPRGMKGDEIPLAARIFSVVDVWDALCNDRPYRKAWEKDKIIAYIREQSGKRFDPTIVDVFLEMITREGF